jgi:polar amino acid transport system substrate-binding protein
MNRLILALALFMLFTSPCAGDEKVVTLATLTDFAPFCFPREGSTPIESETLPPGQDSVQLQGYSWDVIRESFHAMDYTVRLYVVPWERAMHYIDTTKVDGIFPANFTEERMKKYAFSKHYVHQVQMVIYLRRDAELAWQGLESLADRAVGYVRGWSYGRKWEEAANIIKEPTDTIAQGFELLERGRLSALAGYRQPYDLELQRSGKSGGFKLAGAFDALDEHLMGRKEDRSSLLILDIFDAGREKIAQNGTLQAIDNKWQWHQ